MGGANSLSYGSGLESRSVKSLAGRRPCRGWDVGHGEEAIDLYTGVLPSKGKEGTDNRESGLKMVLR